MLPILALELNSAIESNLLNCSSLQSIFTTPGVAGGINGGSNENNQGGNSSNYNQEGTNYIHTGRPGRPRKADSSTNSSDYDTSGA
mgnify:CR=1 FL=1